jgi:formylglycine-generating enzyme required for sulfatase activity
MKSVNWILIVALTVSPILIPVSFVAAQQKNLKLSREVTAWPSREKRYALLVGVNTYEHPQITPLIGAANDMVLLEEALVKYGGFDRDRVVRLTTDATDPMSRPTAANILEKLSNVLKAVPADGLVVFAFSGHGIERQNRAFLLPTDARVNDDIELLERTALEVASLRRMIENRRNRNGQTTGVAQVVVLLDACRNDPTSGKDTSTNPLSDAYDFNLRNSNVQAFATIYATSRGERAYENRAKKHGYFIAEVVAGLSGAAANAQGEVTLQRLVSYLEDKVPTKVTLDLGHRQLPFMELKGYKAADLVISVNHDMASRVDPPGPVPGPTPLTPAIPPEEEAWRIVAPSQNPEVVRNFLKIYPEGRYSAAAQLKLVELTAELERRVAETRKPELVTAPLSFMTATIVGGQLVERQAECQVFTEDLGNGVKLEMVKIPAGEFLMGESEAGVAEFEKECRRYGGKALCKVLAGSQTPQHRVSVNEFLMGRHEVTQRQWRAVMGELPPGMEKVEAKFKGDDKPVVAVSWDEAKQFIERLGNGYRLPSEAEWEYAARGGTSGAYGFGETITPEIVNFDGNYPAGSTKKGLNRNGPVAVGSLPFANAFGLYEMHGNVWEWCEDDWHENYAGAPTDGRPWIDPTRGSLRVVRGGGWFNNAVRCRSAYRIWDDPGSRYGALGFRLVRTLR